MKRLTIAVACSLALMHGSANAGFFFFFIPGSVVGKVTDALTGAEGEHCVSSTAKVGDVITSPTGNTATVTSLSGTSSRCQRPEYPVRAAVKFNYSFSSEAGMSIPDGFEQKPLADFNRFNGSLLRAEHPLTRAGFMVSARPRSGATSPESLARVVATDMSRLVDDFRTYDEEQLTVNGMKAARFEAEGKNKGIFGPKFTYVVTVLEGDKELLVLNAWAPSKQDFASERQQLRQLAFTVQGLRAKQPPTDSAGTSQPPVTGAIPPSSVPSALTQSPTGIETRAATEAPAASAASQLQGSSKTAQKLRELSNLYKEGVITQEEFEGKKKQLLDSM